MYILKFHFSGEIFEMKVSNSISVLKKYAKNRFDGTGLYKTITYKKVKELVFVYGDGEEIGVIGEIDVIYGKIL